MELGNEIDSDSLSQKDSRSAQSGKTLLLAQKHTELTLYLGVDEWQVSKCQKPAAV